MPYRSSLAVSRSSRARSVQVRAGEAELAKPRLHFRHAHEQFPQQACAMVFHHHDDRSLINREESVGGPVMPFAERIDKTRSEEHTSELQSLMRISSAVFCLK